MLYDASSNEHSGRHSPVRKQDRAVNLLRFWASWARDPKRVGAIAPSGRILAHAMMHEIPHDAMAGTLPIIELGGGTGSITAALLKGGIAPHRLVVVERDEKLAQHLQRRFHGIKVACGDAGNLPQLMQAFGIDKAAAIVSGLPLLLFEQALLDQLIAGAFELLEADRPFIQFTYGTKSPVPERYGLAAKRIRRIWANFPPATIWTYRAPRLHGS